MATETPTGRLPGYETTVITRAEMSDEALKTLNDKMKTIIDGFTGEIILTEDWGKRKLAYPIQKETRVQYTYLVYTGKGEVVHELERNLRIHDHVLRFMTVNLEKEFNAEAFSKRRIELQAASKRREEEREARREERNAERRGYEDRGPRHVEPAEESFDASSDGDEE